MFFFSGDAAHRDLHVLPPSSPTRGSSDLAVGCESLAGAAGATRATSAAASFRIGARKLSGYTPIHSTTAAIGASSHNSRVDRSGIARTSSWTIRSEEHTSELQSLMRISYAVFCLTKQKRTKSTTTT